MYLFSEQITGVTDYLCKLQRTQRFMSLSTATGGLWVQKVLHIFCALQIISSAVYGTHHFIAKIHYR